MKQTNLLYIAVIIFFLYFIPVNRVSSDTPIAISKSDIVINKTTEIIARDGDINKDVARTYALWIYAASWKYSVDPFLILSVMSVESTFNSKVVSGSNAIGLMQIIHFWHREKTTRNNLFDPRNNIMVGTRILAEYSKKSDSDIETLARYNGTWGKTNKYAIKVLAKRNKYKKEISKAVT